jgi:signal peptidase I
LSGSASRSAGAKKKAGGSGRGGSGSADDLTDDGKRGPDDEDEGWDRAKANAKTIGGAVILALFIRIVLFEAFEIDGPSMEPTLQHGDRVVVAKFMYGLFLPFMDEAVLNWGVPEVGDVVIVNSPYDGIDIVKRVIGAPGDTIEIRENVVYRNGEPLQIRIAGPCLSDGEVEYEDECQWVEEGIDEHTWFTSRSRFNVPDSLEPAAVPEGHIFVMGDHRDRSNDSRNPRVGMIPATRVKGRALAIYWSSNDGAIRWSRIFEGVQ